MLTPPIVRRRTVLGAAAAIPVAGVTAGCTGAEAPAESGAPARVSVLTGLGFQPWEAYLDYGIAEGFFAEENLEVQVRPGAGTGENLRLLVGNQAEFATLDVNAAIMEYSKGADPANRDDEDPGYTDFVLTCVLHDSLLACVMTLASSGIERPRDLAGRTIAAIPGGINTVAFPAFADLAGFDAGTCELVNLPVPAFNAALAGGEVDAIMRFTLDQFRTERDIGQELVVFPYSEWLPELYGSGIGVRPQLAEQNPALVAAFNRAALRSLRATVDNPEAAAAVFAAAHPDEPTLDVDSVVAANQAMATVVRAADGLRPGELSERRLSLSIALMQSLGVVDAGVTAADVARFDLVS
jgi:NitT/TauT family transport system substrate-binding protein